MTLDDLPPIASARPIWLVTLADLALLLVGFFVLLQSTQSLDRKALAAGFRHGFDVSAKAPTAPDPMPVEAGGMAGFASGSATLPGSPDALVAWVRDLSRDPRIALRVTGSVDGSPADVDASTGSGAILAADRARAVAAALASAHAIAPDRLSIATGPSGRRRVLVTLAFTGSAK